MKTFFFFKMGILLAIGCRKDLKVKGKVSEGEVGVMQARCGDFSFFHAP